MKIFELENRRCKFESPAILAFLNKYANVKSSGNIDKIQGFNLMYKSTCDSLRKILKTDRALELYPINDLDGKYVGVNIYNIEADKVKKPVSVYIDYETSKNFIEVEV